MLEVPDIVEKCNIIFKLFLNHNRLTREHGNILCDTKDHLNTSNIDDILDDMDNNDDEEDDLSDWENSIETSDLDTTEESSPENDVE
ncbi:hypothetical protein EVAR_69011_1, partial [Eumeta japonica]